MRILYFSPHPTHDIVSDVGYSTHQREMIKAMRSLGHEVLPVIIGGATKEELPAMTVRQGSNPKVNFIKKLIPGFLWRTLKDARLIMHDRKVAGPRLEDAIQRFQPDMVYERSEYNLLQGAVICAKHGIPHVYEVNAPCVEEWTQFEGNSLLTGYARSVERKKFQLTTHACCVSSALKDFITREYGFDPKRALVTPNAINLAELTVDEAEVERYRKQYGFTAHHTIVGFVGSIWPYHGVDIMIESAVDAMRNHPNMRMLIVGDGLSLPELKQRVKSLGMEQTILFAGRIPHQEIFNQIALMDVAVMAKSNWYGSPVKIFEYGAMKKAIIAPDVVPVQDVMEHEKDGLLVNPDQQSLHDAMARLMDDPALRLSCAESFYEKVKERYHWPQIATEVLSFVNETT